MLLCARRIRIKGKMCHECDLAGKPTDQISIPVHVPVQETELTGNSVWVEQEAREGAVLPAAAVDGAAVEAQPDVIADSQRQDGMVAGRLVVGRAVVGVRRSHHLIVAHQVDVKRNAYGQLKDVEKEDVRACCRAGKVARGGIKSAAEVAVEQVEGDGLVQSARRQVCGTSS